jgi:hypothetical protein
MSYRVEAQQDFIQGLRLSWVSVTQVTIGAGRCADSTGRQLVRSASTLTVDITASGAGGIDTGSEANSTWYAVYLIAGPTGIAGLLSTSATTPTKPAGYPFARRVGWIYNHTNDIMNFVQSGQQALRRYFWLETAPDYLNVLTTASDNAGANVDCSSRLAPTSSTAFFRFYVATGRTGGCNVSAQEVTNIYWIHLKGDGSDGAYRWVGELPCRVDKGFRYKTYGSGGNQAQLSADVLGWTETL